MRRIYFLSVLYFLLSSSAFSQVQFGIKAGIQTASVHEVNIPQNNMDAKARLSYHVGGFSNIVINQRMSLLMEVLYSNKGYFSSMEDIKAYLHYINLPVLLNYEVVENLSLGICYQQRGN